MRLEDIGFYTLSNKRAFESSSKSPLHRCELILTDRCNFSCVYCRGLRKDLVGNIPFEEAHRVLDIWISQGLKNVRFSGGEPTLYDGILQLVAKCSVAGVERIAISTNGSSTRDMYDKLLGAGVNDFSIPLDSGCCSIGDAMSGVVGSWDIVIDNIRYLSKKTYVTVGMVFTEENIKDCIDSVLFADSLGVSDIRVIPAAQYKKALTDLVALPEAIKDKYPILKYRINNARKGMSTRGITEDDCDHCWLALDDMAVASKYHFPCIIYMREGGNPIGEINDDDVRQQRYNWVLNHSTFEDKICREMCLDVCVAYNNVAGGTHTGSDL